LTSSDDDFEEGTNSGLGFSGNLFGDPFDFLVRRRCPEIAELGNPDVTPSRRKTIEKQAAAIRSELQKMPRSEFETLFKKEKEDWFRSKDGIIEEYLDFMHPTYCADLTSWGKLDSWTIDEAGALMLQRDPDAFPWDRVEMLKHRSPMFRQACDFRRAATRAVELQKWKQAVPPVKLLDWATEHGFKFPDELASVVRAQPAPAARDDDFSDDKLSPREIRSLAKLVTAMAITRYRYDPYKANCRGVTAMELDVKALKMDLTAATIGKLIKKVAKQAHRDDIVNYFKENPINVRVQRRRRHST
jgi:hypothetical protein